MQPRLDRPFGEAGNLDDLFVRQRLDIAQQEQRAVIFIQLADGANHDALKLRSGQRLVGAGVGLAERAVAGLAAPSCASRNIARSAASSSSEVARWALTAQVLMRFCCD